VHRLCGKFFILFYFIVVYIPEKQKINDIKPHTNKEIEGIISRIRSIIDDIINHSGEKIKLDEITEEKLKEMCEKIDPVKITLDFYDSKTNRSHFSGHLGVHFNNHWCKILIHINEILMYQFVLDHGLIRILNKIKTCSLTYEISSLRYIETSKSKNMKSWSNGFYNLLNLGRELSLYYQKNINEEFKNPFIK